MDAFARRPEGHYEADERHGGIEAHGVEPPHTVVTVSETGYEGQRQPLYHELGDGGTYETYGGDAGAFLDVTCHHPAERRVGRIVERIHGHQ